MSDFSIAYLPLKRHEGGYANNRLDRGGETYAGISRKNWPGWSGWKLIDAAKSAPGFPGNLRQVPGLPDKVADFYQENFWSPNRYGEIASQEIANWMLDRAVNCGDGTANRMLQRALGGTADGVIGSQTLAHANAAEPAALREQLREQAIAYYRHIVDNDPSQACFLDGWLARA
jgi:lysozyme family protein